MSADKRTAPEVEATARAKGLTTSRWLAAAAEAIRAQGRWKNAGTVARYTKAIQVGTKVPSAT